MYDHICFGYRRDATETHNAFQLYFTGGNVTSGRFQFIGYN
jgi:hypothetical protein